MSDLYNRIEAMCQDAGIKVGTLCRSIGIRNSVLSDLKSGKKSSLSTKTLSKIAEYFNVTTDYLLGAEKAPAPEGGRESDIERAKIALFGGDGVVTDEMWDEAIFAAQLIKERHKRKKD